MRILVIGKRHYTHQDLARHRFGRIYWLPEIWRRRGVSVHLALLDYHGLSSWTFSHDALECSILSAYNPALMRRLQRLTEVLRPDIVMSSGDCFTGLFALSLARRTRSRLVFDVYDDYRTFGAYRLFLGWDAFGFLCKAADLVTYASKAMFELHRGPGRRALVPNGIDEAMFTERPKAFARERLSLPARARIVGYFGSMTAEHGVNELINAVQRVRMHNPETCLLVCGPRNPATHLDREGVLYRGMVPHDLIPDYLSACDVLAIPYLSGAFLDKAASCKIAEYLACGRPIVATRTPNFVENFPDQARHLDSLLVRPGDVEGLADAIDQQLSNPVVLDLPANMTWSAIADRVLIELRGLRS